MGALPGLSWLPLQVSHLRTTPAVHNSALLYGSFMVTDTLWRFHQRFHSPFFP